MRGALRVRDPKFLRFTKGPNWFIDEDMKDVDEKDYYAPWNRPIPKDVEEFLKAQENIGVWTKEKEPEHSKLTKNFLDMYINEDLKQPHEQYKQQLRERRPEEYKAAYEKLPAESGEKTGKGDKTGKGNGAQTEGPPKKKVDTGRTKQTGEKEATAPTSNTVATANTHSDSDMAGAEQLSDPPHARNKSPSRAQNESHDAMDLDNPPDQSEGNTSNKDNTDEATNETANAGSSTSKAKANAKDATDDAPINPASTGGETADTDMAMNESEPAANNKGKAKAEGASKSKAKAPSRSKSGRKAAASAKKSIQDTANDDDEDDDEQPEPAVAPTTRRSTRNKKGT